MFFTEPSEEESEVDTEGNKILQKQKKGKLGPAEEGTSSGVTAVRDTSKGEFFTLNVFLGLMPEDNTIPGLLYS